MKEKSQLLVEMDKISKVKDELTAELENMSSQLQQERSKVSALTDSKKTAVNIKTPFLRNVILTSIFLFLRLTKRGMTVKSNEDNKTCTALTTSSSAQQAVRTKLHVFL